MVVQRLSSQCSRWSSAGRQGGSPIPQAFLDSLSYARHNPGDW